MRKIVMYCDRCKKQFENWNHKRSARFGIAEFVYKYKIEPHLDSPKDLCESCYIELANWFDFPPQAESEDNNEKEIL